VRGGRGGVSVIKVALAKRINGRHSIGDPDRDIICHNFAE